MGLREILANTNIEDMSIANYMQTVKSVSETLALTGSPMNYAKLIHVPLRGLGSKFKSPNAAIRARDSLISFEELHDKLVGYELALKRDEAKNEKTTVTAQFNQISNYNNKGKYSTFNNNMSNKGMMTSQVRNKYPNQGNLNYRPSHGNRPSNNQLWRPQPHNNLPCIVCQLCDKPSHGAKTCSSQL